MRVRSFIGLAAAALILAAVAVPRLFSDSRPSEAAAAPVPAAQTVLPVDVLVLQPKPLKEEFATTGTLRANERVDVVCEIAGVVRTIHFQEGSPVRKGDVLVEIDDTELQAQRDRVESRLKLAELREQRQRELREQGVSSEADYDIAFNELAGLKAELRLTEAQLLKTKIHAPFAGIIGLRNVSEGALLSPSTRIATLQDLDPIKLDFTLPEKYASKVAPGKKVSFRVEGSDAAYAAEVYAVEPRVDPETRSLVIRARTPNPSRTLLPGAFADVSLTIGSVDSALVVPSLAIIPELGGKKVFVLEDGAAQPRRVETGIRTESEVQVTTGLQPGDRVIVSSIQQLRPGLPVNADDSGAAGASASR